MYLIEGIPLTNIPRSEGLTFSYFHSSDLARGSVAIAPIGRRDVGLLVLSSIEVPAKKTELKKASFKLRPLKGYLSDGCISESTITFIEWLSRYYYTSPGQFARLIIPSYIKENMDAHLPPFDQRNGEKFEFSYNNSPLRFAMYVKNIGTMQENGLQTLVLFPEAHHAELFFERLPQDIKARAILWKRPRSLKKEHTLHKKIIDGEFKTIIGTRSASLLSIPNLGLIIVEGEENDSFKSWDAHPRYDARTISLWRATTYSIGLQFGSDIPSVSTFVRAKESGNMPEIRPSSDPSRVHVVDMRQEKALGNNGPLSEKLKKELSVLRDQQAILLIGKRGEYTVVICTQCGKAVECGQCGTVLITRSDEKNLFCRFCSKVIPAPETCEICAGKIFTKLGAGAQKIEEEVSSLFPNLNVERLDSDVVKTANKFRDIVERFNKRKIDILVGTNMVAKPHIFHPVQLTAIVDSDHLLNIPDYDGSETCLVEAYKMHMLSKSTFIWQTHSPEHEVIFAFTGGSIDQAIENMSERRKKYSWPPSVQLIQLTLHGKKFTDGEAKALTLYQKLCRLQAPGLSIYPPLPLQGKRGARTSFRILLSFEKSVPISRRNELLDYVPSHWDIDVDPVSTIN